MKNLPSVNRRRWVLLALLLAIALAASLLLRRPAPVSTPQPSTDNRTTPASIAPLEFLSGDIVAMEMVPLARGVDVSGPLVAVNQALARSKIAGELIELKVREGDPVKAGQVLGRIDATEATARKKEREALLASAQASLDAAIKTLDNNRNLLAKGFVSQAVVDTATANADVARAQRDAAIAQLQVAEKQLGDTRILAPVTGQVAERMVQQGERVSIDARILSIVDTRQLELQASIPAADMTSVQTGQAVELTIEGLAQVRKGKVSRISPAALGGSRSVPVFIAIDGPDAQLRPGLFAKARIATGAGKTVLAVPQSAIRDQAGRQFVYRVAAGDTLESVTVQTGGSGLAGPRQETWVEITNGLNAGDRIVGPNLGILREGATVRIRQPQS